PISTISYSTLLFIQCSPHLLPLHSFPTRRSSDLTGIPSVAILNRSAQIAASYDRGAIQDIPNVSRVRSANAVVRAGRQQFGTSRKHGVLCHISGNGGIRGGIPDQAQLQLAASLNYCFGFG